MKRFYRFIAIYIFAIIVANLSSASKLSATEGSCYLKALRTDVYVKLYDLNRAGEKGPQIWQGRINQGQKVLITTPHARFRYYYNDQPDINQPMNAGSDRWCDSGRTVAIP
jgi:hypothetical protein